MLEDGKIYLGTSRKPDDSVKKGEYLDLKLANRHGLITGATGTGKTVSLQILTEGFSNAGVPVFCADVKGDLEQKIIVKDRKLMSLCAKAGECSVKYSPKCVL